MSLRDWLNLATVATVATEGSGNPASVAKVASVASVGESANESEARPIGPDVLHRRTKVLAILAKQPDRQVAVVAGAGDPAHVAVAIRGVAVGDLTIPGERYDAFALLALMNEYGHA